MRLPPFEFVKPASTDEGLAVLEASKGSASLLAGGTDLLVNMKLGVSTPQTVVSLGAVPELTTVSEAHDGSIHIGACCTLSALQELPVLQEKFPAVVEAIASVASQHVRNMATIGGNVCLDTRCWYFNQSHLWRSSRPLCFKTGGDRCHAIHGSDRCHAINHSDAAPALLSASARVVARSRKQQREIPLAAFFNDDGQKPNLLRDNEILTEIVLPPAPPNVRSTFIKVRDRRGIDFAAGSVAASTHSTQGGTLKANIVIGALTSAPVRLEKTAQIVGESGFGDASIAKAATVARSEFGTLTNLYTSAGYKRTLIEVLVTRALHNLKPKRTRRSK